MVYVILSGLWVGLTNHQRCQVSYVVHEELSQWPWSRVGVGGGGGHAGTEGNAAISKICRHVMS